MNEGCEGGWPHMNGFFNEHAYHISEECLNYEGKTKGVTCSESKQCKPHSKVLATNFVGSGWGEVSVK
jgi:hypothetical protein